MYVHIILIPLVAFKQHTMKCKNVVKTEKWYLLCNVGTNLAIPSWWWWSIVCLKDQVRRIDQRCRESPPKVQVYGLMFPGGKLLHSLPIIWPLESFSLHHAQALLLSRILIDKNWAVPCGFRSKWSTYLRERCQLRD